ncbi:hypothetical protein [Agarilytica rhodophyticola]|uniref:hypothetical protein n=1 Tax=Agarilytica rhodophyticola TaxID=1737490 RepID=UPI000B343626|nr:hypothetical protein [Agarilytica rhodophyticola]
MSSNIVSEYESVNWLDLEVIATKAMNLGYKCMITKLDNDLFKIDVIENEKRRTFKNSGLN